MLSTIGLSANRASTDPFVDALASSQDAGSDTIYNRYVDSTVLVRYRESIANLHHYGTRTTMAHGFTRQQQPVEHGPFGAVQDTVRN